jgi:hypothetical protein
MVKITVQNNNNTILARLCWYQGNTIEEKVREEGVDECFFGVGVCGSD